MDDHMDEQILVKRTEELVTEIYGQDNPVSEEEIAGLVRGLQNERHYYARVLAKAMMLSGLTAEQLASSFTKDCGDDGPPIDLTSSRRPKLAAHYLADFNHACEKLLEKGYHGERLVEMLNTPFVSDRFSGAKMTVFEAIKNGMRGLSFYDLPKADQAQ